MAAGERDGRLQVSRCLLIELESLFILKIHLVADCQVQLGWGREGGLHLEINLRELCLYEYRGIHPPIESPLPTGILYAKSCTRWKEKVSLSARQGFKIMSL